MSADQAPPTLTPGQSPPGQSTPGQSTPGQSTPGQSTPGQSTPGQSGRIATAVAALAVVTVVWAALPVDGASPGERPALVAAVCCALLSVAQLAAGMLAWRRMGQPDDAPVPRLVEQARLVWDAAVRPPWPQLMIGAVVALEALHRPRPWHTAVLGLMLLAWLLTLHLAETAASLSVLRPQRPLIAAGLGLAGLSVAAATIPQGGAGSGWLAVLAAVGAVLAAAFALPV